MATRSIVTHQPEVECDVCGRRLLRGERPDAFIDSGHRRIVCELCMPRAVGSGWTRESEALAAEELTRGRSGRARSTRSLMGRLRQRRPSQPDLEPERELVEELEGGAERSRARRWTQERGLANARAFFAEEAGADTAEHDAFDPLPAASRQAGSQHDGDAGSNGGAGPAQDDGYEDDGYEHDDDRAYGGVEDGGLDDGRHADADDGYAVLEAPSLDTISELALRSFNESGVAGRVAGIARALGEPEVSVRTLDERGQRVAIVVAWELCWYRYEVDLAAETPSVALAGDGMELHELPAEDRVRNARADERGALSLL
ncbi:MAG: hypothetical protein ACYCUM_13215 [Solirubrobacteraceae bacterium]